MLVVEMVDSPGAPPGIRFITWNGSNTGGGGGGGGCWNNPTYSPVIKDIVVGGSGIVLIAYPPN